jgi:hypothetical protein
MTCAEVLQLSLPDRTEKTAEKLSQVSRNLGLLVARTGKSWMNHTYLRLFEQNLRYLKLLASNGRINSNLETMRKESVVI